MQTISQPLTNAYSLKTPVTVMKSGVTKAEIDHALKTWGNNLVAISKAKRAGSDFKKVAENAILNTYFYQNGPVLFKPTLASKKTFRTTYEGALSYFIGGNTQHEEDRGFALNPWESVEFEIAGMILGENHGIVMGNKHLKDNSGKITIANFTMGFVKDENDQLRINLHHSSLPYQTT